MRQATRAAVLQTLWAYIKAHRLQVSPPSLPHFLRLLLPPLSAPPCQPYVRAAYGPAFAHCPDPSLFCRVPSSQDGGPSPTLLAFAHACVKNGDLLGACHGGCLASSGSLSVLNHHHLRTCTSSHPVQQQAGNFTCIKMSVKVTQILHVRACVTGLADGHGLLLFAEHRAAHHCRVRCQAGSSAGPEVSENVLPE